MRFMYIVVERPMTPSPALMEAVGKLADRREIKAGRLITRAG